ncbi:hypothetical protein I8751_13215 [Nostocaceae cyanobacterium CENA357]|uniref:Uncharacterized protein n=1 Tax=Atlanticothrix silvestris CENA357 TaxID=1725252 RepID=A0A8J7L2Y7_9CYAN|nr:hypothetical protein [Atlanticothrix silvestris]MBH8553316.1 hypothetical protein [Atlanticothrix silvestris CENA357]
MPLYSNNSSTSVSVSPVTSTTGTDIDITIANTATQVLAANANRKSFTIYNQTSVDIYFDYSSNVTTANYAFKLSAGSYYEMPVSPIYQGAVFGIVATGTASPQIRELV